MMFFVKRVCLGIGFLTCLFAATFLPLKVFGLTAAPWWIVVVPCLTAPLVGFVCVLVAVYCCVTSSPP
jgi:uncharacterized membrane protein (DUF2068 family)